MAEQSKIWYTGMQMESPFFHVDITPEEYLEENDYLGAHYDDYLSGIYKPLWVQRGEKHATR